MFSVKGFAVGKNVTPFSGSAGVAIVASNIAASIAVPKHAVTPGTGILDCHRQA
jgi:hypothetical protein